MRLGSLCVAVILACTACSDADRDGAVPADVVADQGSGSTAPVRCLEIQEGGFQVGFHGETMAPVAVRLTDGAGRPVAGETVRFAIRTGPMLSTATDGSLTITEAQTDAEGRAESQLTLGQQSGLVLVAAWDQENLAVPATFRTWSYRTADDRYKPLALFAMNDLHMRMLPRREGLLELGGLARLATLFKRLRTAHEERGVPVVVANLGDDFENTLFHNQDGSIPELYRLYDAMGVDFIQVGNHDYHFGIRVLDDQVKAAEPGFGGGPQGHPLRFLWGNVDPATLKPDYQDLAPLFETDYGESNSAHRYQQTLLLDFAGLRVGILGVATDAAVYTQVAGAPALYKLVGAPMQFSQGLTFLDPDPRESDYIAAGLDALHDAGADTILVASHAGLGFGDRVNIPPGKDEFIAQYGIGAESGRVPDVILSAHSHVQLNQPIPVTNPAGTTTWLTQGEEAGQFVVALALEVDTQEDRGTLLDYHLLQVDQWVPEDADVAGAVGALQQGVIARLGDLFAEVLGTIAIHLSHRQRAQSGLGQMVADAFLDGLSARSVLCDVAMVIPSIYRADLFPGPITASDAYDIVPLHNLDQSGIQDEPLVIWETRPGLYNCSVFGLEATRMEGVTVAEYVLEAIYSIGEVLESISPGASDELNLEVVQFAGMSFQVDGTAPPFQRLQRDSLRIHGEPVDPSRSYRLAMVHSVGVNLAYVIDFIVQAEPVDGGPSVSPLVPQGQSEEPWLDTGVPAWELMREYLAETLAEAPDGIPEAAVVTGERFRSVEPDLMVNPTDIVPAVANSVVRGEELTVEVTLRNLGDVPVSAARVDLYYESTPWDQTDDDDGHLAEEGFAATFHGSLEWVGSTEVPVGPFPETAVAEFVWPVPPSLVPWEYPLVVRIEPATGGRRPERVIGNNRGPDQWRAVTVVAEIPGSRDGDH